MNKAYQRITDHIIQKIEEGNILPWAKPWTSHQMCNMTTLKPYQGANVWSTLITALVDGYASPYWLTYKQAKDLGGNVRKGESATPIIYYNFYESENEAGELQEKVVVKWSNIFNLEQIDGIPEDKIPSVETIDFQPIPSAQVLIDGLVDMPSISHDGGSRAYYRPSNDTIHLPRRENFKNEAEYYSTAFHELAHSTGHSSRLEREGIAQVDTSDMEKYCQEELIAEFASAMLCAQAGIEKHTLDNSTNYIGSWVKALKDKDVNIVNAASQAQKAVNYILEHQGVNA